MISAHVVLDLCLNLCETQIDQLKSFYSVIKLYTQSGGNNGYNPQCSAVSDQITYLISFIPYLMVHLLWYIIMRKLSLLTISWDISLFTNHAVDEQAANSISVYFHHLWAMSFMKSSFKNEYKITCRIKRGIATINN